MTTSNTSTSLRAKPFIEHILLCDDDEDDFLIFKMALADVQPSIQLSCVNNGEELMHLLRNCDVLPHCIFLDLNMPRKNGLQCRTAIQYYNINALKIKASFYGGYRNFSGCM